MPSPTSITVPTSLTCTRCSKPAISCFKMLVISATLSAISRSPVLFFTTKSRRPRSGSFSAPRFLLRRRVCGQDRESEGPLRALRGFVVQILTSNLHLAACGEHPLPHRLQLVPYARVDQ